MDLSINNINLKNKNINFKGMEGAYDKNSAPVYKFYAPPYDRSKYNIYLEYAPLNKNEKTSMFNPPIKRYIKEIQFDASGIIEVPQAELDRYEGFGYRYKLTKKSSTKELVDYLIDPFKSIKTGSRKEGATIKEERMNVIERGNFYGVSPKGGSMRHSFLDSDVRLKNGSRAELDKDFVRNHFNKLGGSIEGLNWLLKNTDELAPYRYFMTTPDIGVDKVSSHKYWPANQYQCSDLETFKDFNFELFKQGKGYVADGAFTSQGIQSPLVQHVLKWGEESPFYHWLKIDGEISLGILPDFVDTDGENPYNHIGVRLVNGKGANYDETKPTYIQLYDDRLLSKEAQIDGRLHFDYDSAPDDHYEITSHQDSIQPYAFEIDPNDKKIKVFKDKNAVLLKDIGDVDSFLTFPNFTIAEKGKISGITCWDGNVDIIKMNLSNPNETLANRKGFFDAREYIHGVADYWTNLVQSHLILETAKADEKTIRNIFGNNNISKERYEEIKASIQENGGFISRVIKKDLNGEVELPDTSTLVKNFPLQTLETSDELSAIFTQPQFKEALFDEKTTQKISKIFDSIVQDAIPENLKTNNEYRAYVIKTYGNEILRQIFASALKPSAVANGKINLNELKNVTLKSLEPHPSSTAKDEVNQVASKIKKGINEQNLNALKNKIKTELETISLENFKLAEALVLQGKGGLNWRFDAAKDIGDLDAVRDKTRTFNQIWKGEDGTPGVQQFWAEYVRRIRQSNPSAYVINEVTTLNEFTPGDTYNDPKTRYDFDPQLETYYSGLPEENAKGVNPLDWKRYENHPLYTLQTQFIHTTNSTTTSEFAKGFNSFSKFAGVNPENPQGPGAVDYCAGNLSIIKKEMEELAAFYQPNSAIYSHMFVSNHDKPSVLHTMPLDMSIYMPESLENLKKSYNESIDKDTKKIINYLINGNDARTITNFEDVNPKALAVGIAMYKTIDKLNYTNEEKNKLKASLANLVNGRKTQGSKNSYKRAESFGVKPYEITIRDVIKNAGIISENKLDDAVLNFHSTMLHDSMIYFERMWQVMNACIGVPTLYGGNEFAQTGYETPSKNVYLGIRNEVLHDLQNDPRYSWYFEKMKETSGLYKTPGLSALRDGTPVSLEIINGNSCQAWPLYKKDSKGSETVSIITNLGLPSGKASYKSPAKETISAQMELSLKDKDGKCPFEEGTPLKRVGDNLEYIIKDGAIRLKSGGSIMLSDTVTTFYVPKKLYF